MIAPTIALSWDVEESVNCDAQAIITNGTGDHVWLSCTATIGRGRLIWSKEEDIPVRIEIDLGTSLPWKNRERYEVPSSTFPMANMLYCRISDENCGLALKLDSSPQRDECDCSVRPGHVGLH
jgi:hypothetical protein